jgi:predicted RNA-binding protein YlqC (UPF0109 family)
MNPYKVAPVAQALVRRLVDQQTEAAMQMILLNLVRAIVLSPDAVAVTQIVPIPPSYRIQVAHGDFQSVLSRLHYIKTFALSTAKRPTDQTLILQLDAV